MKKMILWFGFARAVFGVRCKRLLVAAGMAAFVLTAQAAPPAAVPVFSDNFESGTMGAWTTTATAPLDPSMTQNSVPAGGQWSALLNNSLDRMHHNLIADNGGAELSGHTLFTCYIYDPGPTAPATRIFNEVRGYSGGTGLPNGGTAASGSLAQLFAIGKYNTVTLPGEVFTSTKYQGRVTFPTATGGWFNLNAAGSPNRSVGWHRFDIERMADGTTINFYVDGILSRTFMGATAESWDTAILGSGLGSTVGDAWIDGISVGRIDTTPPAINCPSNIIAVATSSPGGAVVHYAVTATDDIDTSPTINCTPPSGSTFPVGTTTVLCTATDDAGNISRCTFDVTVLPLRFEGFEHWSEGQAVLTPESNRLVIANLGSGGQDGWRTELKEVQAVLIDYLRPPDYYNTCIVTQVEISMDGVSKAVRTELLLGDQSTARVDFSAIGSDESDVEIRRPDGTLLDKYRIPNDKLIDVGRLFPLPCVYPPIVCSYYQDTNQVWWKFCKPECGPCIGTNCWFEIVVCIRAHLPSPGDLRLKALNVRAQGSAEKTSLTIEDIKFFEFGNEHHAANGVVDAADYVVWRKNDGLPGLMEIKPTESVHPGGVQGILIGLLPLDLNGIVPCIRVHGRGIANGLPAVQLGMASLRGSEEMVQLSADFRSLGATMVQVEVRNGGQSVGRLTLPNGVMGDWNGDGRLIVAGIMSPRDAASGLPTGFAALNSSPDGLAHLFRWDAAMDFKAVDGTMLKGDEVRLLPADPMYQVQLLQMLSLGTENIESFTIVGETVRPASDVFFPQDVFPPPTATWGNLRGTWDMYGGSAGGPSSGLALARQRLSFFDVFAELPAVGETRRVQFGTILEADLSMNRGASSECVAFRGRMVADITGGAAQGDTRFFDIEIFSMDLGVQMTPYRLRESPTLPSHGKLSVRPAPEGGFYMSSFFDVFTELSLDGGTSWVPGDTASMLELMSYQTAPFAQPNLPPALGTYAMQCAPVDYPNQVIIRNLALSNVSQGPPLDGILIGMSQTVPFSAGVGFLRSMDGGMTWQAAMGNCQGTFLIRHSFDYEGTAYYDTEMLQLNLSGGTIPTGLMLRESPTLPSRGRACLGRNDTGQYLIASFFDVFTELSLNGGQTFAPATRPARLTLTHGGNECLTIRCPPDQRIWTCEDRAIVNYPSPTATSACGTVPVIECIPPSGSFFPVGIHTVNCRATDGAGNAAFCSFKVEVVQDSAAPQIVCPGNITNWVCTPNGGPVTYTVTATDDCDTNVTIVCTPPSGSNFLPGTTTVDCVATDDCGKKDECRFVVFVRVDTEPPRINCPEKIEICTCNPNGTNVTYTITATDDCDTNVTVVCSPPSGSFFPPGTSAVTCTARDDCGKTSDCSFPVTVTVNSVAIVCPPDMKTFTCSNTAVVNYNVDAVNRCTATGGSGPVVVCNPPSGSSFPIGTTTVTCRATNECGFSDTCEFRVTVEADQQPPRIICPNAVAAWTCSDGTVVNYTVSATDDHDTNVTIVCNPPSGSVFPVGVTIVTCVATDDCGKTDRCEFPVRVIKDTEPPRILCPTNIVVFTCRTNARAHYTVTATDDCDTNVTIVCTPPSGSLFPLGTTTVHCIATDDCGNRDECRFTVLVQREVGPPLTIRRAATTSGFIVCWPAPSPGWRLQCSPTLERPDLWVDVTTPPVLVGSQWCVPVPNDARHRFYRLYKPCDPIITGVSHLQPHEGDILTITGSGFGFYADNLCLVVVENSFVTTNPPPAGDLAAGLADGVRFIPLRVLSAQDTVMTARMGPVPPDAKPGKMMVGHGIGQVGRFQPAFPDILLVDPVWTWNKFGPAGMGEEDVEPQPEQPQPNEQCFFSGEPQNGELCVFIQGDWKTNCHISIIARAHDSVSDTGGHDLDAPTVRFLSEGTTRGCVERIVDVLRCAFQQQAGVQIDVTFEEVPPGSGVFKITVRIPGGYIDRGMLTICVRCPD